MFSLKFEVSYGWASALLIGGALLTSCGVQGSATPQAGAPRLNALSPADVQLVTLGVPEGAVLVGAIEADGRPELENLLAELTQQAASLGANVAKVDFFETRFVGMTSQSSPTFKCEMLGSLRSCQQVGVKTVEGAVTRVVGRAYYVKK